MGVPRRQSHHAARWITGPARYFIVLFWLAAAVGAYLYLPSISETEGGPIGVLAPQNSQAIHVEKESAQLFAVPAISRTIVVQRDPTGLSPTAQARVVERALALSQQRYPGLTGIAGALPIINARPLLTFTRESFTTAITYLFFKPDVGFTERDRLAQQFVRTQINQPGDALVGITGVVPVRITQGDRITSALRWIEVATVILTATIVGAAFRSFGAPLATLLAAGTAYMISSHLIAYVGTQRQFDIPVELSPLLVVLVLAVATDYAIFFLSNMRDGIESGETRVAGARRTAADVIPLVLVAGLTVAAGTSCLIFAKLQFLRVLGPALGGAVLVTLIVAMTMMPALLAIGGRLLYWPRVPLHGSIQPRPERSRPRDARHPLLKRALALLVIFICVSSLLGAASGLRRIKIGMPLVKDLPGSASASQAAQAAAEGFVPGIVSPTEILVQAPDIANDRTALARLEALIAQEPGVAGIVGPREQPTNSTFGVVLSKSGDAARYVVILSDDPYGAAAINHLRHLESHMPHLMVAAGLPQAQAGFAGDTAVGVEIHDRIVASIVPVALATGLLDLMLMLLLLRSFLTPVYLLATSVLAVMAPLGLTVYFFQSYVGYPYLSFYMPVAVAVLLVSMGADYNLFVVGSIWEEARERPLHEAVMSAGSHAGRAIRVAAVTLSLSFATLAIIPLSSFREFAVAMAVGVLMDAFLIRSYLVPALISVFGNLSFWPRKPFAPGAGS